MEACQDLDDQPVQIHTQCRNHDQTEQGGNLIVEACAVPTQQRVYESESFAQNGLGPVP